jgi:hypothetical protein
MLVRDIAEYQCASERDAGAGWSPPMMLDMSLPVVAVIGERALAEGSRPSAFTPSCGATVQSFPPILVLFQKQNEPHLRAVVTWKALPWFPGADLFPPATVAITNAEEKQTEAFRICPRRLGFPYGHSQQDACHDFQ